MKELTKNEIAVVSGGIEPELVAYYLYMESRINSVYAVAKYVGTK